MTNSTTPLDQLRGKLVAGIPHFDRRRRRLRLLQSAVGIVMVGALVTTVALARDTTDSTAGQVATDAGGDGPRCPKAASGFTVQRLSASGIPAVLFASDVNTSAVAVIDLDGGCRAVYPAEAHTLGGDVIDAAFTSNDQLIAQAVPGSPLVYPAGRTPTGQQMLVDGGLAQPGQPLSTGRGDVFPTDSGDAAWVLPATSQLDGRKPLRLVNVTTGAVQEVTVPAAARLVDVVGESAVLHPAAFKPAGVGAVLSELEPGHEMLVVSPSGETATLEAPEPAAFVAATQGQTIWIAGNLRFRDAYCPCGDRVLVVADDGTTTSVPVPDGEGGQWIDPARISLSSPPLPTVTTDGARLLLLLTNPGATPDRLAIVDLKDNTTDVIQLRSPGSAFWAHDDQTAIVVHEDQSVTAINAVTGATTTLADALPADFQLIAGR